MVSNVLFLHSIRDFMSDNFPLLVVCRHKSFYAKFIYKTIIGTRFFCIYSNRGSEQTLPFYHTRWAYNIANKTTNLSKRFYQFTNWFSNTNLIDFRNFWYNEVLTVINDCGSEYVNNEWTQ